MLLDDAQTERSECKGLRAASENREKPGKTSQKTSAATTTTTATTGKTVQVSSHKRFSPATSTSQGIRIRVASQSKSKAKSAKCNAQGKQPESGALEKMGAHTISKFE